MERYREYFHGKRITLMGLGLLGRGVGDAAFLAECGAELIVTDLKSKEQLESSISQLRQFPNIIFRLGEHRLVDFTDRDLIVKAAGVPLDSVYIAQAKKDGIPVRMSADLFVELSGVAAVGVTGTRGKTTTTHMIASILRAAGKHVLVGGNIRGVSTLSLLPEVTPSSVVVLELDSWQLQGWREARMSPHVAVFTTFYPDHMNYYKGSMESYFADKAQIFLDQDESDTCVLGEQVAPFVREYGYQQKIKAHAVVAGDKDIPRGTTLKVPGGHNRHNAGVASVAARALGVEEGVIKAALESFEAVEGRLQFVREVRGVKIYNDNNSTTPDATLAALRAFGDSKNIVLIMGGSDKGLDMTPLVAEATERCKQVFLLEGAGTERIKAQLQGAHVFDSLDAATTAAFAACEPGDILLFSPAFASFGMFKNEYERNDVFVEVVGKLV